jgi:hypothetical protein
VLVLVLVWAVVAALVAAGLVLAVRSVAGPLLDVVGEVL